MDFIYDYCTNDLLVQLRPKKSTLDDNKLCKSLLSPVAQMEHQFQHIHDPVPHRSRNPHLYKLSHEYL
ncbi:hypothetical protein CI610_03608 [invertebrate metagenome]|uniref:Uncharacterized protein n=1 Tax=invertebrate metagenome TaxID=1711999 RepID=A0A2H9T2M0_9ZZZZ